MDNDIKVQIGNTIDDLVSDFLYYDRGEDEDLPRGDIEKAIASGLVTVDEITAHFRKSLESNL